MSHGTYRKEDDDTVDYCGQCDEALDTDSLECGCTPTKQKFIEKFGSIENIEEIWEYFEYGMKESAMLQRDRTHNIIGKWFLGKTQNGGSFGDYYPLKGDYEILSTLLQYGLDHANKRMESRIKMYGEWSD